MEFSRCRHYLNVIKACRLISCNYLGYSMTNVLQCIAFRRNLMNVAIDRAPTLSRSAFAISVGSKTLPAESARAMLRIDYRFRRRRTPLERRSCELNIDSVMAYSGKRQRHESRYRSVIDFDSVVA